MSNLVIWSVPHAHIFVNTSVICVLDIFCERRKETVQEFSMQPTHLYSKNQPVKVKTQTYLNEECDPCVFLGRMWSTNLQIGGKLEGRSKMPSWSGGDHNYLPFWRTYLSTQQSNLVFAGTTQQRKEGRHSVITHATDYLNPCICFCIWGRRNENDWEDCPFMEHARAAQQPVW